MVFPELPGKAELVVQLVLLVPFVSFRKNSYPFPFAKNKNLFLVWFSGCFPKPARSVTELFSLLLPPKLPKPPTLPKQVLALAWVWAKNREPKKQEMMGR
ncbi:MAG: hypothetical protein LBQ50_05205 [Planctomycetaceae bacterium]|nr:hypothetical protein [Planctomycetaceae bacterium]